MTLPLRRYLSIALLLCGAWGGLAAAANLQISPVMINFRAEQTAAGIALQNLGDAPVYGQVRVFIWDQQDGDEVLTPTQELVASPPIVQIAANGSQTIRLVRTAAGKGDIEHTYRVLIDEVAGPDSAATTGVDIRLRYSVPVFVATAGETGDPVVAWNFYRKDGVWMLKLGNSGRKHAQIGAMILTNKDGKEFTISKGLFGYVLAGRTREWRLPVEKDADLSGKLAIKVVINAKVISASNTGAPQ